MYTSPHWTTLRRRNLVQVLSAARSVGVSVTRRPHVAGSVSEPRTRGATDERVDRAGVWEPETCRAAQPYRSPASQVSKFSPGPRDSGGGDRAARGSRPHGPRPRVLRGARSRT